MANTFEQKFYADELASKECICGNYKTSNFSFCPSCYYLLPDHLKSPLYRKMGDGYEEAYEEAVAALDI